MELIAGLAAVSNGIAVAKAMRAADKNLDAAVMRGQIADITEALTDAKLALAQAKEDLDARDKEIKRLLASVSERAELKEIRGGFQYKLDAEGNPVGYPVCPTCIVRSSRVVQLVQDGHVRQAMCPNCHTKFPQVTLYYPKQLGCPETAEEEEVLKRAERDRRAAEGFERLGRSIG